MRLIDADALNLYDISPVYGFSVYGVTAEDIGLAPTIEPKRGEWIVECDAEEEGDIPAL